MHEEAMTRLTNLSMDEMPDAQRHFCEDIIANLRGGIRGPFNAWVRSPELADPLRSLLEVISQRLSVSKRLKELTLLITVRFWDARYAWSSHVPIALNSGLDRVAILSQYRSYSLINHIGIGAAWDMIGRHRGISILPPYKGYGSAQWYRGSADAVFQNLDFIQYNNPEVLLILSGDHVYNMDYREIINYHCEKDADLTMACLQVDMDEAHRFGVASIDNEDGDKGGRVVSYLEKPERPEFNWASLTVFCR